MLENTSLSLLQQMRSANDEAAWQQFISFYGPLLDRWLGKRGVPPDVREDIRQDVLLVIAQQIEQFEHNGRIGAFRNWLRQILAHRLRTATRRHCREAARRSRGLFDLGDQLADPHSELSQLWNREHDQHALQRLLEMISPRFQEDTLRAFEQIVLHGRDTPTVAAELNMTVNAVRIAQSRVLAALREVGAELTD